jgi:tRNA pseudouridine55 synthase
VLVVCVGTATRLIEHVQQMPKRYEATFLLGRRSPSDDTEEEITELVDPPIPSRVQVLAAAAALTGVIQQRPPAYSAVKVEGQRAYRLARKGQPLDLPPRTVNVHRLEVLGCEYPELRLRVECSSGTYVRSLGRDLAAALGTAAVMSALVRTAIGGFRVEDAVSPDLLTRQNWTEHLLPPLRAVESLPRIVLSAPDVARVRAGQTISHSQPLRVTCPHDAKRRVGTFAVPAESAAAPVEGMPPAAAAPDPPELAAVDAAGHLVAILRPRGPGLLGPTCVLPEHETA